MLKISVVIRSSEDWTEPGSLKTAKSKKLHIFMSEFFQNNTS